MNNSRPSQYAGSFYPERAEDIKTFIGKAFNQVVQKESFQKKPKIIIVPHAGYAYSGNVAAYAYNAVGKFNYKNIFLLGPSHYVLASNQILTCAYKQFETPLGSIPTFKPENLPSYFKDDDKAHAVEHSLEVQLPFLKYLYKDCKIFPQLINEGDKQSLTLISDFETRLLNDSTNNLLVISSDLSHYHNYAEAQKIDKITIEAILQLNEGELEKRGEACGLTPILIGMKIAKKLKLKSLLLKAANSGDATNSFNAPVVGYAAILFY
ncbi:MAG: AmmeMemoRadiSam system protein B [Candidatus Parcubacteria bacterium]|nr:AmmeMemoRadiSam system protein B [Candidatus Parcubacteria bacterium]